MIPFPLSNGCPDQAGRLPDMINGLRFGLVLVMVMVAAYYGALHWAVLRISHPITQDEPGFVEITAGMNAYAGDNLKTCGNVYGPGYAVFARPFTVLMANPYLAHRWANTVALGLTLGLLGWQLRREGVGLIETVGGLVIVYALNVSSHSLAASADLLAAALCFGALVAGRRGTWPALALCLLLSVLGGLTKLYAVFGWLVVASHLVFFAPRAKAFAFVGVSALGAVLCVTLLSRFAPGYFLSTFVVHWAATTPSFAVLRNQTAEFVLLTCGLVALALWCRPRRRIFSLAAGRALISPAIDLWEWAALWAAALLLGKLGWHAGNYLVYYYHLLLIPLVIVASRRIEQWPRAGRGLLIANLLVLGWQLPPLPGNDHWASLELNVTQVNGPVLAEPFFEPFAASHPNIELFEHGQTASILQALDWLGSATPSAYVAMRRSLLLGAEAKNIRINAEEFDAIYLAYQNFPGQAVWCYDRERFAKAVEAHYKPVGEILFYPYCAPFWDRKRHGQYACHITKWVPNRLKSLPANPNPETNRSPAPRR